MRYPLLFLLFLFFFSATRAQIPLDSLYKDGTTFVFVQPANYYSHSPTIQHIWYDGVQLKITGDTTVSSITYKKIYYRSLGGYQSYPNYEVYNQTDTNYKYSSRLRISNKCLYITKDDEYATDRGVEQLRFDFSKNVGDSTGNHLLITAIDSVQLNTGDYVKKFYYTSPPEEQFSYTEGLGGWCQLLSYLEIFYANPANVNGHQKLCYNSGSISYHYPYDNKKYMWNLMDNCFDLKVLDIKETKPQKQLTLYPNPSNGSFAIEGNIQAKEANLVVYNIFGQLVYSAKEAISNNYIHRKIDLLDLPKGVYHLIISSGDEQHSIPLVIE